MDESLIREQEAQLQKTGRYYKHICFMAVPVLWMACFLYGVRPLLLCGIAVLTGNLCDRLVSLLRRRVYQGGDFSNESFALVIALLMPVTVDIYVLIAAVLAGASVHRHPAPCGSLHPVCQNRRKGSKDLRLPYSIFTLRYFINSYSHLSHCAGGFKPQKQHGHGYLLVYMKTSKKSNPPTAFSRK